MSSKENNVRGWNITYDMVQLLESLQCGESRLTIIPSLIYLIGIALLVHHIITMNIRPQLYRRIGRELLLQVPWQEILIIMLVYQCIRLWLSLLIILNTIFKFYEKRLILTFPNGIAGLKAHSWKTFSLKKALLDLLKYPFILVKILGFWPTEKILSTQSIQTLDPTVQELLSPTFLKIVTCTLLALLPAVALIKLKERRPIPHFMLWMGPLRRDRSELGASGYYLERPITPTMDDTSSEEELKRSSSVGSIVISHSGKPKKLRARKSV